MKNTLALFLLLILCKFSFSQSVPEFRIYSLEEARKVENKDLVLGLELRKLKLTELPPEIYEYKNLKLLDVSKNRLRSIPMEINQFKQLEELNAGKNKLSICPIVICSITTLKVLKLNDNPIQNIPECIQYLADLEHLDLFQTRVESFPTTLVALKNLKTMDVRGILYGPKFQEHWKLLMPQTFIDFDLPCNCLEDN
jgi:Leucine-rich repeat (LRR) protein